MGRLPARSRRPELVVAAVGLGTAAATMVATPLTPRGRRQTLANLTVAGLAVGSAGLAARRWGRARAVTALGTTAAGTWLLERVGTATGLPFGRYAYTGELTPAVAGVPAVVPLAWFALGLPAREVAATLTDRPAARVAVGAASLAAWDVFLDPQMTGEGYWAWAHPGHYRGIPWTNYAGWLGAGAGLMVLLDRLLPPSPDRAGDPGLVGVYAGMAAMETLGFAVFFRDRLVALAGGLAMGPPALAAVVAARRRAVSRATRPA